MESNIKCPECGSQKLIKSGHKFLREGGKRVLKQQYECRSCGRKTIHPIDGAMEQ